MNLNRKDSRLSKLKFSEYFFPARPRALWSKTRSAARAQLDDFLKPGIPIASNPAYTYWLKKSSMLEEANRLATQYSGKGSMWRNPYARPRPRAAIKQASVWYTSYPISQITGSKQSTLASLADEDLWKTFENIGIEGLHTGPLKLAGGIKGWRTTPSIDGHFDRISTHIDPMFGSEKDYEKMTALAAKHHCLVIDDIIPGHTGKGADFRLAEMAYDDYPGIYHMVEIQPEHWHLLPEVPKSADSANISQKAEETLKDLGYIIGKLQRVIFYEPGIKDTNWSATSVIKGVDGVKRRWVYLHYFKDGQPSLNWLDPTFGAMRLVIGDALHSLGELGAKGLRLDANGLLGAEKGAENGVAWSEGHPLSEAANHFIAGMVRKMSGFTFQELNLSFEELKMASLTGADLSYDFVNRPAYHHALATEDTEFLRLSMTLALDIGIDPASLVHALQNHDELTYELAHFFSPQHSEEEFHFRGKKITGMDLRSLIQQELRDTLTSEQTPYNMRFTENGVACTTASAIAAILGIENLKDITPNDIERIKNAHLLLAMFNCLQPGVFALSGWDLAGSLTLNPNDIEPLLHDGDTRWLSRGAYDLLGKNPSATKSTAGMPKAMCIYDSLPEQLSDPKSFVNQLKKILAIRKRYGIATSHQLDVPLIKNKALLAMVHKLAGDDLQVTVLNFSAQETTGEIISEHLPVHSTVVDMLTHEVLGSVDKKHSFDIRLEAHQGKSLLIKTT